MNWIVVPTTDHVCYSRGMIRSRPRWWFAGALIVATSALGVLFVWRGFDRVWAKSRTFKAGELLRAQDGPGDLGLMPLASGFDQPVGLEFVPGGGGRAVVLQKGGAARVVDLSKAEMDGPPVVQTSSPFLEVAVRTESEMGLLGVAFHPRYEENGRFFINCNPKQGERRTLIAEWNLPLADLGKKSATFVRALLEVEQPYGNHDGGHLAFGPDGYLYIGLGDGGAANDPHGHGQNLKTLLGAMSRIDVDGTARPYGIPADNPFVARADVRPEIWAYGLRNPWRYSFDPAGHLIAGDVGQNSFEEIDVVTRGANMGWNVREARHCFAPKAGCTTSGMVDPIFEYGRDLGSSVTGGVTYTGQRVPALANRYVFGDFVSGNLWSLQVARDGKSANAVRQHGQWRPDAGAFSPVAFARTLGGEVVVVDFASGALFRLTAVDKHRQSAK